MDQIKKIAQNQLENNIPDDAEITKTEDLQAEQDSYESGMIVATSGTSSGEPTHIHYTDDDLDRFLDDGVRIYEIAGINDGEVVLNPGAPRPHFSAWFVKNVGERMDQDVVNDSIEDIEEVIGTEDAERVTTTFSIPEFGISLGRDLEEKYGEKPRDLFPDLEKVILSGELPTEEGKENLEEYWGFDTPREIYGASEIGPVAAAEDDSREMVPLLDRFIFEIVPDSDEYGEEPVDIREFDEPETGRLLVTDPEKDVENYEGMLGKVAEIVDESDLSIPGPVQNFIKDRGKREGLIRCDPGDAAEVIPHEDGVPRIKILGKYGAFSLGGAQVYDGKLEDAIAKAKGEPESDYLGVKSRDEEGRLMADFYVPDVDELDYETFFNEAYEQNPALEEVDNIGSLHGVDFHPRDEYNVDWETIKRKSLVDETRV